VASLTQLATSLLQARRAESTSDDRRAVRDSLIVTIGGQLERVLGTFTALALRWGLDPARLGVYSGLRLYLDNTNRSSLGIGLGAVQEIPILRAAGRHADAEHITNVAHTANTITCSLYALALLVWAVIRLPLLKNDPFAAEWTWGLVAIAALTLLQRYLSFLIAVLRAHQEFALTTQLDVFESLASAFLVVIGLWLGGFWGLLGSVGVLFTLKVAYLHARNPLRFRWAWDWPVSVRLMRLGLPILANTAALGAVMNLDEIVILWRVPNGAHAFGLYTIALMGTGWSLDLAGRIATVMYTYFQTTLGRTSDPTAVARQAVRVAEAQAPILAAGGAVAYLVAPKFLGLLMPRYAEGLPALRPLLPGMLILGLAWPARQMLITIERPYRLCAVTVIGLALSAVAALIGAERFGIVGVAWAMTLGYCAVYILTSGVAFYDALGATGWMRHQLRLAKTLAWFAAGSLIAAHAPISLGNRWLDLVARCVFLAAWGLPPLWVWARRHNWGGLFPT
jgi:O-antigen/teichoic acid export membrane protein